MLMYYELNPSSMNVYGTKEIFSKSITIVGTCKNINLSLKHMIAAQLHFQYFIMFHKKQKLLIH